MFVNSSPVVDAFGKADLNAVISKLSTAEKISLLAVSYPYISGEGFINTQSVYPFAPNRVRIGGRRHSSTELAFRASSARMDRWVALFCFVTRHTVFVQHLSLLD